MKDSYIYLDVKIWNCIIYQDWTKIFIIYTTCNRFVGISPDVLKPYMSNGPLIAQRISIISSI